MPHLTLRSHPGADRLHLKNDDPAQRVLTIGDGDARS